MFYVTFTAADLSHYDSNSSLRRHIRYGPQIISSRKGTQTDRRTFRTRGTRINLHSTKISCKVCPRCSSGRPIVRSLLRLIHDRSGAYTRFSPATLHRRVIYGTLPLYSCSIPTCSCIILRTLICALYHTINVPITLTLPRDAAPPGGSLPHISGATIARHRVRGTGRGRASRRIRSLRQSAGELSGAE